MKKPCVWTEDEGYWVTSCGSEFVINEGTPKQNKMKYCCYCGGTILENVQLVALPEILPTSKRVVPHHS